MENENNIIQETELETSGKTTSESAETAGSTDLSELLSELSREDGSYLEEQTAEPKKTINKLVVGIITGALIAAVAVVAAFWFMANPPRTGEYGNTYGNMMNYAFACEKDGWTYYTKSDIETNENGQLINQVLTIERTDGKQTQTLADSGTKLSVAGNHLYYVDVLGGMNLYRVKTDGTGKQKLTDDEVSYYIIKGKYIYYVAKTLGGQGNVYTAYEMKLDGSGVKQLLSEEQAAEEVYPTDEELYYRNVRDGKVYKTDYDGKAPEAITNEPVGRYAFDNDSFYYIALTEEAYSAQPNGVVTEVYKADKNGSNPVKIAEDAITLNVKDGKLYYTNINAEIHSVDVDGQNDVRLTVNARYPSVVGDLVYYENLEDNRYYKMNLDGSDPRLIQ